MEENMPSPKYDTIEPTENQKCSFGCDQPANFIFTNTQRLCCSKTPSGCSGHQQKKRQVYRAKTGYDNPAQNPEVRKKMEKTCTERFGVPFPGQAEEVKKKAKENAIQKYGVDHHMKDPEIKQRHRDATLAKGGFTFQRDESKQKARQTTLERYGHENYFGSDEGKERVKSIMQEKYGVDHPSQLPDFLEKREQVYLGRRDL